LRMRSGALQRSLSDRAAMKMRIAVMAAGAVGGYFGARMAAAGHDVTFVARGAHWDPFTGTDSR
jgi:hypothetical protein